MRIDSIQIENFRGIGHLELTFHPRFTLLVGDNGSGKTAILSAVSVALGIWHLSDILGDARWRDILEHEVREVLSPGINGERQFMASGITKVTATGTFVKGPPRVWVRQKRGRLANTVDEGHERVAQDIKSAREAREARTGPLPLIAYYGAGRAWMASHERPVAELEGDPHSRLSDGYDDCLAERIRVRDVMKWFVLQAAKRDERGGFRPAFEAVRLALKRGIPGVGDIHWDYHKAEIVVSLGGSPQIFSRLSDGQRMMAATLADMAIRAVTLNPHLLGDGNGKAHPEKVLDETPGVVLIDELDVHLHPAWQRSVITNLISAFPKVQFICSSHSAQVAGELPKHQVWMLGETGARHPSVSYADSNWVLEHSMGIEASSRNHEVKSLLESVEDHLEDGDLAGAEDSLERARARMEGEDGELTRLESSLATLNSLAREDD